MKSVMDLEEREWEKLENKKTVYFILNQYIHYSDLTINQFPIEINLRFYQLKYDNSYLFTYDRTIHFQKKTFVAYMSLSKQLEFKFKILKQHSNKQILHCEPIHARISKKGRTYKRFPIQDKEIIIDKFVFFKDFNKNDKNNIELLNIIQQEHSNEVRDRFPNSKILSIENKSQTLYLELELLKQKKQPIYFSQEPYLFQNHFYDIRQFFSTEEKLIYKLYEYKKQKIESLLLYPIFTFFYGKKQIFAYGYAENLSLKEYIDIVEIYKDLEKSLNQQIVFNAIKIDSNQKILNISLGGFLLEVTDKVLIEYFLKIMFFSAIFFIQNKIKVESISEIKHIRKFGNRYYIGFQFLYPCFKKGHLELLKKK